MKAVQLTTVNSSGDNMKFYTVAVFLLVAVAAINALPVEEYEELVLPSEPTVGERADRHRRVTCDLLSIGGVVGDSACAANCLSMGKAGGSCNGNGVCVCRRETLKELWNKRFG